MMSGEKRPAHDAFGPTTQLVAKRNKPDNETNAGTSVIKSSAQNGALVQSVRYWFFWARPQMLREIVSRANHDSRFPAPVGSMLPLWNLQVYWGYLCLLDNTS